MFKFRSWSTTKKVVTTSIAIIIGLGALGSTSPSKTGPPVTRNSSPVQTHNTTTKTVVETQAIPFEKTSVNDPNLAQGTSQVTTQGINGVKSSTYRITYTNGNQTSKDLVSEVITTPPVNEVTSIGTYVAPSNPYPGATAICNDGTPSYSSTHQGTCSHHGGVSQWLQ